MKKPTCQFRHHWWRNCPIGSMVLILAVTLALTSGCATGSGRHLKSYTADSFPVEFGTGLVQDVVDRIYSAYPPGQTEIFLTGKDDFALALEEGLRNRGYALVPEGGEGCLSLAWTVARLDENGHWFLTVNLSDGYRFSRVYRDSGQAMVPVGGLSQGVFKI